MINSQIKKWNNGEDAPNAPRIGAQRQVVVQADPDACFTLACPVAELDWIEGWQFDMVYSDSGRNEVGCIFLEPISGPGVLRKLGAVTSWTVTRYDPAARRLEAVLHTAGLTIASFELRMDPHGQGATLMRWKLTYTGISAAGRRIVSEDGFEDRIMGMLDFLAQSARQYMETGERYKLDGKKKAEIVMSMLGAAVGRHFRAVAGRS